MASALSLLGGLSPASAAPDQIPLDDVVKALHISRKPSDYVIVVDTSGSMKQANRYAKVKSALRSLLEALQPDDQVSLVTFDTAATVRFRRAIGTDRLAALRSLPASPEGKLTDIGAGISAGIGELEASDANQVGAIVLITDGKLDTANGSPYRTVNSEAWAELRGRAAAIAARHQVASYAIALESSADAALLKQAFPQAEDIPAKLIDERFAELDAALIRFQATQLIQPDLARGVEVAWDGNLTGLSDTTNHVTTQITLHSTYEHIPVKVTGLTLSSSAGPSITAKALPKQVELNPGQSVTLPLELAYEGTGQGAVTLNGTVTSPWQRAITKSLGLSFAAGLMGATELSVTPTVRAPEWLTPGLFGALGGVAALVALIVLWRVSRPKLVGSLAVSRGGEILDEFLLTGRSMPLSHRAHVNASGLQGSATAVIKRGATKGDTTPGVKVQAKAGKLKGHGLLVDGQSFTIGDLQVTYTSARTRMIDLISHGDRHG